MEGEGRLSPFRWESNLNSEERESEEMPDAKPRYAAGEKAESKAFVRRNKKEEIESNTFLSAMEKDDEEKEPKETGRVITSYAMRDCFSNARHITLIQYMI